MPSTRRTPKLLALGAAVTATMIALWRRLSRQAPTNPDGGSGEPPTRNQRPVMTVELTRHGAPFTGAATVTLRDDNGEQNLRADGDGHYRATVRPGSYELRVALTDTGTGAPTVPSRRVQVRGSGTWRVAVLDADQPFLRLGGGVVPIKPRPDQLTVTFVGPRPPGASQRFSKSVAATFGWRRVDPDSGGDGDFALEDDALVSFQAPSDGANTVDNAATLERLAVESGFAPDQVRVGFLIEGDRRQRAMLDGEFVVAFNPAWVQTETASAAQTAQHSDAVPAKVQELVTKSRATVLQPVRGLELTYLVRFDDRDYKRHLATAERFVTEGIATYAEPNLAARVRDCFSLAAYQANRSANLDRMNAEAGWAVALAAPAPATPVKIGTLDRGIDPTTPFIDNLTLLDSAGQVVVSQTPQNNGHGMSVASIASGNGTLGCWGVAPFLPHVAVQRTSTTDIRYWDAFDLGFVPQGVSVVSISHESEWLCADSASQLKVTGYVNSGMVIVVAAGNDSRRLDELPGEPDPTLTRGDVPFGGNNMIANPLAAHANTITVGNTMLNSRQAETFWSVSSVEGTNRGDYLDVCAFGHNILAFGSGGAAPFTGTSAAAPLVAGTIGLLRHVNPALTVAQIRAILGSTTDAVQSTDGQWLTLQPGWASPGADWDSAVAAVPKHNLRYGFGRINIGQAVAKALALKAVP